MRRLFPCAFVILLFAGLAGPARATTDPSRSKQWALDRIRATEAWSASKGSGVTIAIVDTGIDLTHPDLKGKIASHYTCINACATGGDDDNGHGSHVAGIAAAATSNGIGIAGVAPSARLMAVKVLGANGRGSCADIDRGIRWAADRGADVINLSLTPGAFGVDVFCGLQDAAAYAWDKGVVVVVAAGNDGLVNVYGSNKLIVVGATGPHDEPASYSNAGADVYAPGGNRGGSACTAVTCIFSTWKDGGYAIAEGTSMATPHVSGIAALLVARGYSNTQVQSRLGSTADNVDGIKRVNAARAVGTVAPSPVTKPRATASTRTGTRSPRSKTTAPATVPADAPSAADMTPMPVPTGVRTLAIGGPTVLAPVSSDEGPSRTILISVATGLALLAGSGFVGGFLLNVRP